MSTSSTEYSISSKPRYLRLKVDWEFWLVGFLSLIIFCVVAYLLVFRLNIFLTDSMARTRAAWQVFFSSEPKLENVGFVWAPLPTILQLPLVIIPAMRYKGISGNLVTAICGAVSVQVLLLFLRQAKLPVIPRWLLLASFVLNPFMLFYSANGMSEVVLALFVLLATYFYLRWHQTKQLINLIICGIATSLAFLSRYDASFVAAVVTIFIGLEYVSRKPRDPVKAESLILIYASPVAYTIALWIFFNWLIMGDPLYFLRSAYSNAGQIGYQLALIPDLLPLKHNMIGSLWVGLKEATELFPVSVLATVWLAIMATVRRNWIWLGIIILAWSLTLFSVFNIFLGQSALFLRYFFTTVPMGMILIVGVLIQHPKIRTPLALLLIILVIGSSFSTVQAMQKHTEWGQWNDRVVNAVLTGKTLNAWQDEEDLAYFINTKTSGYVLMDDFQGYRVIFFSGKPWRFITPSDSTFKRYLREPYNNIDYIMTSSTELEGELNQVNNAYPYLFKNGANWVSLEYENSIWKLYRIVGKSSKVIMGNLSD